MAVRTLIIVLIAMAALSGCGRRGNLEPPGGRAAAGVVEAPPTDVSPLDPGSTVVSVPRETQPALNEPQPAPKRHFFLDFLL